MPQARSSKTGFDDHLIAALIFLVTLVVFWFSPVHQITDSHYSMLLSQSLLQHRSFALDHYNIPRLEPHESTRDLYVMNGDMWQLELARGHIYYYFPMGSSVLSLPYVAVVNAFGISSTNPDGTYDPVGEERIQTSLAAILMAITAVLFYFTGRLLLSRLSSVVVALAGVFGTQVWSIASRGLWSHTWAVLLTALLVLMLLANETGRRRINPYVLATLLAWLYFVRPNESIVVVAVTVFTLLFQRTIFARFAVTGALWLAVFITYSWINFGKLLPSYYQATRLGFDLFPVALAGNLISPSRGLIVYVPVLLFVAYLIIRYWGGLSTTRLVWLSLAVCLLQILFMSAFANLWGDWWGGASFGPRYTTEIVPWFVLLAVLGLNARASRRSKPDRQGYRQIEILAGVTLVGLSIFINARGATSIDTWKWSQPSTDRQLRALLWDWRHPQFLAGLQSPAAPIEFPIIQPPATIDITDPGSGKYLWYGWSGAEKDLRWSDGKKATAIFGLKETKEMVLDLQMAPFLASPMLLTQRLTLKLNNQAIETVTLSDGEMKTYSIRLPARLLESRNVLLFELPDAVSPHSLGFGNDNRLLGIRVGTITFRLAQ